MIFPDTYILLFSLMLDDQGVWNCVVKADNEDGDPKTKFIFVDIGGTEGPEILKKDNTVEEAVEDEEISLICPTSIRPSSPKTRPTCIWVSPSGLEFDIVGR